MTENKTLNEILEKHNVTAEEIAEALYAWLAEYGEEPELMKELAEFLKLSSL